ncbi:hypothetical protein [uncultured Cedecea sp.]|uniref:hypothetical protein n=1 Tax=uncultured Cedecea sp. TaxID=988762 RepID=UPI002637BA0D|nr:hypothetical protein [uncultured Cedecea sp.]
MIPNFITFYKKYRIAAFLAIVFISSILTSSLIRNVIDISLPEMIVGLGAISMTITWNMMRDGRGYFIYSIFTLRFYDKPEVHEKFTENIKFGGLAKIYYRPFYSSLLTLVAVVICCTLIWLCGPALRYWLIAFAGVVVMPAIIMHQSRMAMPYNMLYALQQLTSQDKQPVKARYLPSYITEDLLLSLVVNFALVLPVAAKPAFSLSEGYGNPAFIVAFIILMTIVMLFMFCFALRQRRYILLGELLNGDINDRFASTSPWSFTCKLTTVGRLMFWLFLTAVWSIIICLLFSATQGEPNFALLYVCSLLPLIAVYCVERHQTLYTNFREAQEMKTQYASLRDTLGKTSR